MADVTELIERLRSLPWCYDEHGQSFAYAPADLAEQAAAEIERLRDELGDANKIIASECPECATAMQELMTQDGCIACEYLRLRAEIERLKRGEFICLKCGLRKDSDPVAADF